MKYSYPDSLITLAAALEQACSLHRKKYDDTVANVTPEGSTFLKLNINNHNNYNGVGIKFDNISAGKYFALIHSIQHNALMNKATEKFDEFNTDRPQVTTENE